MQTLALQSTTTFVDDTIEFVRGFGRSIVERATAPIERIARACDVAGVLERRRTDRAPRPAASGNGRCNQRNCPLSPFGGLSELTRTTRQLSSKTQQSTHHVRRQPVPPLVNHRPG
jgi:hypothetical protein